MNDENAVFVGFPSTTGTASVVLFVIRRTAVLRRLAIGGLLLWSVSSGINVHLGYKRTSIFLSPCPSLRRSCWAHLLCGPVRPLRQSGC